MSLHFVSFLFDQKINYLRKVLVRPHIQKLLHGLCLNQAVSRSIIWHSLLIDFKLVLALVLRQMIILWHLLITRILSNLLLGTFPLIQGSDAGVFVLILFDKNYFVNLFWFAPTRDLLCWQSFSRCCNWIRVAISSETWIMVLLLRNMILLHLLEILHGLIQPLFFLITLSLQVLLQWHFSGKVSSLVWKLFTELLLSKSRVVWLRWTKMGFDRVKMLLNLCLMDLIRRGGRTMIHCRLLANWNSMLVRLFYGVCRLKIHR